MLAIFVLLGTYNGLSAVAASASVLFFEIKGLGCTQHLLIDLPCMSYPAICNML